MITTKQLFQNYLHVTLALPIASSNAKMAGSLSLLTMISLQPRRSTILVTVSNV